MLKRVASATLQHIESGALAPVTEGPAADGVEGIHPDAVANAISGALSWLDAQPAEKGAGLEAVEPGAEIPYIPNNQVLALLQSAYDEYLEKRTAPEAAGLEMPFDEMDPGWLTVAFEKLKELFRGKHKFISHTSLTSFRYALPSDAVVALFGDWGTGQPTAQRVMQQIKAAKPTHAVHLGDVYYSGTPREEQTRFLDVI